MRKIRAAMLFGLLTPVAGFATSCAADLAEPVLDQGCTLNSDCEKPLLCVFQLCHKACTDSSDCPMGDRCVLGEGKEHVCQLPSEAKCTFNSDCPRGEVCATDDHCRDQCTSKRDCISPQDCVDDVCADPTEVSHGHLKDGTDGGTTGTPCMLSSDCAEKLVCRNERCQVQCREHRDCIPPLGPGGLCVDGVCSAGLLDGGPDAPPGYGQPCNLPSDCPSPLRCGLGGVCVYQCDQDPDCGGPGICCVAHECTTGASCSGTGGGGGSGGGGPCKPCTANDECDDGKYCNGEERCFAGCCSDALEKPCDSHSACIHDTCNESTQSCHHQVIAGEDVDGDGHLAYGCSGGDDCDDGDPTSYAGHVESFDGRDNDCNGFVDDWTSEPKGGTPSVNMSGTPAQLVVPIGGGPGGWLGFIFASGTLNAEPYDASWTPGNYVTTFGGLSGNDTVVTATSETNTAAVLLIAPPNLIAAVAKADGTGAGAPITLDADSWAPGNLALPDLAWGGTRYIAGWPAVGYTYAGYCLIDTNGNSLGSHQVGLGGIASSGNIRVAGNGSTLAVAYIERTTFKLKVDILDQSGAVEHEVDAAPAPDGSIQLFGLGGAGTGYVVVWGQGSQTLAAFVPQAVGQPLKQYVVDPIHAPSNGHGASDGVGAAFMLQYVGALRFGYLNGNLLNPFEFSQISAAALPGNIGGGADGRLGVSYSIGGITFNREAGFAGLTGATCTQNTHCASGLCKPVVMSGPGAYKACK